MIHKKQRTHAFACCTGRTTHQPLHQLSSHTLWLLLATQRNRAKIVRLRLTNIHGQWRECEPHGLGRLGLLIARIAASHRDAHTALGEWWICCDRNTCRVMPSTRSRENRAIGWGTFAKRTVCDITFAAVWCVGTLGVVVVVGTTLAPVADEERTSLFDARTMIVAGRIRTGNAFAAALSIAQRMP